jgi:hypothetical protein
MRHKSQDHRGCFEIARVQIFAGACHERDQASGRSGGNAMPHASMHRVPFEERADAKSDHDINNDTG